MTREEFNRTGFTGGMKATFDGVDQDVVSVDLLEGLIGIVGEISNDDEHVTWKRCESITELK